MKPRNADVTPAMVRKTAVAVRGAGTAKEAVKLLLGFCEYYRKNYAARRNRLAFFSGKNAAASKKWREANEKAFNAKRRAAYREKAEREWRDGRRKRKPRWLV